MPKRSHSANNPLFDDNEVTVVMSQDVLNQYLYEVHVSILDDPLPVEELPSSELNIVEDLTLDVESLD